MSNPPIKTPARRLLRAFAFDPMSTRLTGRFLTVDVPFERDLEPGPSGRLVRVIDYDAYRDAWYQPVDLNDPFILAQNGLQPSESDPRTHQQVVYAVSMSVIERFERFVGRRFRWIGSERLDIVPHAFPGRNAYFDPARGAVLFGYYRAETDDPGANLPGQLMFTCLSTDIIAHEVTHAIVHRLRNRYTEATNPDVFAWHEAFADLVALFHHFLFPEVVAEAIASSKADLGDASALFDLAKEFGASTGRGAALRSAIAETDPTPDAFFSSTEPHERGACFVAAVFDAYRSAYQGRIAAIRRLASGGTGVLPPGALPPDLVALATTEAVRMADRMLGIVVRAFDYLPAVDVTFGDVVRAIVTADRALFPDDALHLRATLVEALRRRGIYPPGVSSLADQALAWERPPDDPVPLSLTGGEAGVDLGALILAATRDLDVDGRRSPTALTLGSTPRSSQGADLELSRASRKIAKDLHAWGVHNALRIGLDPDPSLPIALAGHHVSYLQGADGQPRPIVVVQYEQRNRNHEDADLPEDSRPVFRAGTTIVARVDGEVEYVIAKPLPLTDPDNLQAAAEAAGGTSVTAQSYHGDGILRLERLGAWLERAEEIDPLAAYSGEPAVSRISFARLHGMTEVAD